MSHVASSKLSSPKSICSVIRSSYIEVGVPSDPPFSAAVRVDLTYELPASLIHKETHGIKSWPRWTEEWSHWVDRLAPKYQAVWDQVGISALIQMTKTHIKPAYNLLNGALRLWSRSCNSFVLPLGLMSLTFRDIVA